MTFTVEELAQALSRLGEFQLVDLIFSTDPETVAQRIIEEVHAVRSGDPEARCQCGHTRREHESRRAAPNHCTHRCVPPWHLDGKVTDGRRWFDPPETT